MLSTARDAVCGAWGWAKRHKVLVGGGLLAGTALTAYMGYRALLSEAERLQGQLKNDFAAMRQERLGHDTGNAVVTFLPPLKGRLAALADVAALREQLRQLRKSGGGDNDEKLRLWGELKVLTLTRLFAAVYGFALLNLLLRVQLHVLARSSLEAVPMPLPGMSGAPDLGASQSTQDTPTPEVRLAFLSASCRHALGAGMDALTACVLSAVELRAADWELTRTVSAADLRALVRDVRGAVETFRADAAVPPGLQQFFLLSADKEGVPDDAVVCGLLDETWDLLETDAVRAVADEVLGAVFPLVTADVVPADAPVPLPKLLPRIEAAITQLLAEAEPGQQPFVAAVSELPGLREYCVAILLAG